MLLHKKDVLFKLMNFVTPYKFVISGDELDCPAQINAVLSDELRYPYYDAISDEKLCCST